MEKIIDKNYTKIFKITGHGVKNDHKIDLIG